MVSSVLVIDDNRDLRESLVQALQARGFDTDSASDGYKALARLERSRPDVAVLDILMPGMSGLTLLETLRDRNMDVPVLLLTEFGGSSDRAVAIERGADDYLNKPFDPAELIARINSLIRRNRTSTDRTIIRVGDVVVDLNKFEVSARGEIAQLTPKARRLMLVLAGRPNEVLSRAFLLEEVWGYGMPTASRTLDQRVAELRKVLAQREVNDPSIVTVPNLGYRLDSSDVQP